MKIPNTLVIILYKFNIYKSLYENKFYRLTLVKIIDLTNNTITSINDINTLTYLITLLFLIYFIYIYFSNKWGKIEEDIFKKKNINKFIISINKNFINPKTSYN